MYKHATLKPNQLIEIDINAIRQLPSYPETNISMVLNGWKMAEAGKTSVPINAIPQLLGVSLPPEMRLSIPARYDDSTKPRCLSFNPSEKVCAVRQNWES